MSEQTRPSRASSARRETDRSPVPAASRERPLRALFMHLNQAEPSAYGRQRIAVHAEQSMRVIQLGLAAIGHLLAHSAVPVEERAIPSECIESLGTLMAELGELAALCHQLHADRFAAGPQAVVLHESGGS